MSDAFQNALERLPSPAPTALRLERVLASRVAPLDPAMAEPLVGVLANSHFLTLHLARFPADLDVLATDLDRPLSRIDLETWYDDLLEGDDEAAVEIALRRVKYRAFTRITARDVALHAPVAETCAELSDVAEFSIDIAFRFALAYESERFGPPLDSVGAAIPFTVLGMGKLGGFELNYSSDIDLIYFYGTDDGAAGELTPNAFFTRVGERLGKLLHRHTDLGFIFRVDLDLRPEGRGGPMCNAMASAERYYESWGRTWERLAWLRARPVGGDRAFGQRLLKRLEPWIYRRSLDHTTFEAIRDMKSQIVSGRRATMARGHGVGIDLKLDPGGIRAAEFFVHTLQLVHAGRDPLLRDTSTLGALDRLVAAGHLPDGDRDELAEAYTLLRRVEHRVQMDAERQTHRLPTGDALDAMAERLGFADSAAFLGEINSRRASVTSMFDALMGGDQGEEPAIIEARAILGSDDAERVGQLADAGFSDPKQAAHLLAVARRQPASPFSPRAPEALVALGIRLLAETIRSAEPDRALTHLTAFASNVQGREFEFRTLAKHPHITRLFVSVCAGSDFLAQGLIREPSLVGALGYRAPWSAADFEAALAEIDAQHPGDEAFLEALARAKQRWTLDVGLGDIAGDLNAETVEHALSDIAQSCLSHVLRRARAETARRFGAPPEGDGPLIVALGKLGGRELSYGSDLDVVFLYSGEGDDGIRKISRLDWFTRVAQRTISLLALPTRAGPLFSVDTRLRPGGRQGTLVTRITRFQAYHNQRASTWERLALVRARVVAGPPELAAQASSVIRALAFERPTPTDLRQYARRMRHRMEVEVAREGVGRYNPKTGRGGLVDIEFVVQALQIEHGQRHPAVQTPSTLAGLRALGDAGLLDESAALVEAWGFLRRLDHRLRIVRAQPKPELRADPLTLDRLARRMGYQRDPLRPVDGSPGAQLMAEYLRRTEWVRQQLDERLGTVEG